MKALLILIAVCFSAASFAQTPPPKSAKTKVQPKPQAPMGCKLVGTVKGTKIWAGDCTDATGLKGALPAAGAGPAEGAPLSPPEPSDQKQ